MIGVAHSSSNRPFRYPGDDLKTVRSAKLHLPNAMQQVMETGRMRLLVTAFLFGTAYTAIGARLVDLMLINAGAPDAIYTATTPVHHVPGARANIVDRNGIIIATNVPTANLYADALKVPDASQAAEQLAEALPDLKFDEVLRRLNSGQRFIYLGRRLTPPEQMAVNRLGIPGVYFEKSESRVYPHGPLFAHVIGATDPDNRGSAGIEKTFDESLGKRLEPVILSLDVRVQNAVRETLAAGIARSHAEAGSAVVMDADSGEIVALVSLPDYDPQAMGAAPDGARFNRATLGLYEMGSTFKLFTAATAIEAGTADLNSRYDASDPIKIGRFTINDFHGLKRWLTVPEILIHSSNIGAAKMALAFGTNVQKTYLRNFGLLSALKLELPEVGTPQYPSTWRDINTITIAYGHGISVTPVHMTAAVSALVNGGILHPPTLIHRDTKPEGQRVISAKTSEAMRALMRIVVLAGSGKQADVPGYNVGGKTGSAEKVSRNGGYAKTSLRTSFIATFPTDAPRYVVLVVLDEPHGSKETYGFATAGWNAAPTVGNIVARVAPMLGVFPLNHSDTYQPLTALIQASGADLAHNEYAGPAAKTPVDVFYETTAATSPAEDDDTNDDSIGALVGDLQTAGPGGGGEAQ